MTFLPSLPDDAQIFDLFASRPETYRPFVAMVEAATRGESPLSVGERELIGAFVSSLNDCALCADIHTRAALEHGATFERERERLRPILEYVEKLTRSPERMVEADAESVYAAGFDEWALHDAVLIAAIASFMNRIVLGLGIEAESALREAAGLAAAEGGYRSRFEKRLGSDDANDAVE